MTLTWYLQVAVRILPVCLSTCPVTLLASRRSLGFTGLASEMRLLVVDDLASCGAELGTASDQRLSPQNTSAQLVSHSGVQPLTWQRLVCNQLIHEQREFIAAAILFSMNRNTPVIKGCRSTQCTRVQ